MDFVGILLLLAGLLVGGTLGALAAKLGAEKRLRAEQAERSKLATELAHARSSADEKLRMLREEQQHLGAEFERLADAALKDNREEFLRLASERLATTQDNARSELDQRRTAVEEMVKPLGEQLDKVTAQVNSLEKSRAEAYAELRTQVEAMGRSSEQLRDQTQQLVSALRAPQVRGRWGELQLRRVVEAAGMLEHVDFTEQATAETADGKLRPDLLVNLPGEKRIVVDAKVSFNGFLEAQQASDEATHKSRMDAHARHIREHVDSLAGKRYWEQFAPAPEFVVMFVPSEVFVTAGVERDPALHEYAFERNVILATPATLVALLRTVGYTWRQESMTRNAQEVLKLGRQLHSRLSTLGGHVGKLGRQLNSTVAAYNNTVSSLESRVLVTARKMTELKVADREPEGAEQVEVNARQAQAPELVATDHERAAAFDDEGTTRTSAEAAGSGPA